MRKRLLITTVILSAILGFAYAAIAGQSDDFIVQGIEYNSTLRKGIQPRKAPTLRSGEKLTPGVRTSANASPGFVVEWDKIEHWAGSGPNKAALLVQFNDGKTEECYVWGYRWDPDVLEASGEDMFRAVATECNDLLLFTQYTGWMGNTVCGIGYSKNNGVVGKLSYDFGSASTDSNVSFDYYTPNTDLGQTSVPGDATQGYCDNAISLAADTHIIDHPINAEVYGYAAYDYDWWQPKEDLPADMRWMAGWYKGYWSYWVGGVSSESLSYSGLGMTSRKLTNECVDAWSYNDISIFGGEGGEPCHELNYIHFTEFDPNVVHNGICYTITNYSNKIVEVAAPFQGCASYSGNIEIPSTFVEDDVTYTVAGVGEDAFANSSIATISLPNTVTYLRDEAFKNSTLTSINLSDNVTAIGTSCFAGCINLSSAYIPQPLASIPDYCFMGTALTSLTFPDNIEAIGQGAYQNCSALAEVTIGSNVATIGAEAFAGCSALYSVTSESMTPPAAQTSTFDDDVSAVLTVPSGYEDAYRAAAGWGKFSNITSNVVEFHVGDRFVSNGIPYLVTAHEGDSHEVKVTYYPTEGVAKPSLSNIKTANQAGFEAVTDLTIPSTVTFQGVELRVTAVNDTTFYYADKIKTITIPDGVSFNTGNRMFCYCTSLESISLPSGLTQIGQYMFDNCSSLTSITLPEGVTTIGNYGFNKCSELSSVTLPSTLTTMGTDAFRDCTKIASLTLPQGLKSLGTRVFYGCTSLDEINLPTSLTSLPMYAFYNNAFSSFTVPAHITTLNTYTFDSCKKLTSVSLENLTNLTKLPDYTFRNCSALTEVILPGKITEFGQYAFQNCTSLEELSIPDKVTKLGNYAFQGCTGLKAIKVQGETYTGEEGALKIPSKITTLGNYVFGGTKFNAIVIPSTVSSIGAYAFWGCTSTDFYACYTSPQACNASAWLYASGKYLTVTVPTGTTNSFNELAGWKKATLKEPTIEAIIFSDLEFAEEGNAVTATSAYSIDYAAGEYGPMPTEFADFNTALIEKNLTASASDGVNTYSGSVSYNNGYVTATFDNVPAGTSLLYTITSSVADVDPVSVSATYPELPSENAFTVDCTKIRNWSQSNDSDDKQYGLVFRWNDCVEGSSSYQCPLDNFVLGARMSEAQATVQDILSLVASQNPRLRVNDAYTQFGYEMLGDGHANLNSYDHNKANTDALNWRFWIVAANGTASEAQISSTIAAGQTLVVDYQGADDATMTSNNDLFYVPATTEIGVFLPENSNYVLRDNYHLFVPYFVNVGEGGSYKITTQSENFKEYVSNAPMVVKQSDGCTTLRSHMNFLTGKTGSFPLSVTATIGGVDYVASTNVNILEPTNPITAITLSESEPIAITGYPNRNAVTLTYNFEPADASYTKIVWSSTDTQVATVSSGKISAGGKQGTCEVRATYAANDETYGGVEVTLTLNNQVTDFTWGDGSGVFDLEYMDILLVDPVMEPANADNPAFTYKIIGDSEIATTYSTKDIINHKPGTVQVEISTLDGSDITKTYTVNFAEPDRTPLTDDYQDGTFWLSEEWYTHTNGSINYITPEGEVKYRVYESQNPFESFGATSQFATIYGNRMYVMSKQEKDPGDPRPGGGRLVVLDAKTLEKQASWQTYPAGGDSRACLGVSPDKVYIGSTAGIYVLTVDNEANEFSLAESVIPGTQGPDLYNGQPGDMATDGRYVYVVKQSTGIIVIDAQTDTVVETVTLGDGNGTVDKNPEGIVRAYDGSIWVASKTYLYHLIVETDPETADPTFDISERYQFASQFPDSWMAWRSCNLFASRNENVLYFGGCNFYHAGCDQLYRWEVGSPFPTEPIFDDSVFPTFTMYGKEYQTHAYATGGYDSRNDEFLIAATYGSTTSARYTWYYFIDGTTGKVKRSIELKPYFWFPAMPVFPHATEPGITNLDNIILSLSETKDIDLNDYVSDPSIPFSWINFSVETSNHCPANPQQNISTRRNANDIDGNKVLEAEITDAGKLRIIPLQKGSATVTLTAEANGKTTSNDIEVSVGDQVTGIDNLVVQGQRRIIVQGNTLTCKNMDGDIITICDMNGRRLKAFYVDGDKYSVDIILSPGVYLAVSNYGITEKIVIR